MEVQKSKGPIARDFMSKNILTVYQDQNVGDAVKTMAENNVGSVVVLDNIGPCGVFTERDLLAKVVAVNRDPQSTIITKVLSPSLPAVKVDTTAEDAAATMINKKNRLMVFEGADLVGIITATDIVRVISNLERTFDIGNVISKRIVSVHAETSIYAAVKEMQGRRVGSVIVGGRSKPFGIFTERDLLKRVLVPRLSLNSEIWGVTSSPLITAEYGAQAREVAKMMVTNRIKRIPLYRDNGMIGIITARDLVQALSVRC